MIQTGIEPKVKVQQIIENQLPEYVLSESPNAVEFLKQYYISQEYQGGVIDISDNLDQYLKLDNLTPDVVVGQTTLSTGITTSSDVIPVSSTKGFPNEWGLLKINNEIITYTGVTTNSFIGAKRGFSGITSYHQELNQEELTFSTSSTADHLSGTYVQNLSSLFLQEFYKKLKFSLTPGLENVDFDANLNAGTFIKEARSLYNAKGTDESFRILFNALYDETPKVVNLEEYLLKPSSANYVRREIVIAEALGGDVTKLAGQTLYKTSDVNTNASISEVEGFSRVGVALTTIQNYYKLALFIGYDDSDSTIQGNFDITQATRSLDNIGAGASVITVDSTIGFGQTGTIISAGNTSIDYTNKSVNQFFGCTGIGVSIKKADEIRSNNTYYGYEDGDITKKVELRLTGVLSDFEQVSTNLNINEGEIISVKNVGDFIENPAINASFKEVFANSWIYNTSCRYFIEGQSFATASQFTSKAKIDKSSLKKGDLVEIVRSGSNNVVPFNNGNLESTILSIAGDYTITLSDALSVEGAIDIRRKPNYAVSTAVPLQFSNILSDTSNLYIKDDTEEAYYAANSLPSGRAGVTTDFLNIITTDVKSATSSGLDDLITNTLDQYSTVIFPSAVPFFTGDEIYYKPNGAHYVGLETGRYYCEIVSTDKKKVRLYGSRASIESATYIPLQPAGGTHKFILNSQRSEEISPQKSLKKFSLTSSSNRANQTETDPGTTGLMINGVEITNYKSEDNVYYGPLKSANVVTNGSGYDVVNPPNIAVSAGVGTNALIQPVVQGSVTKVYIDPQGFDINEVQSVNVVGGNGNAVLEPLIAKKSREVEFDGRQTAYSGGVNETDDTITFLTDHTFQNAQEVIYKSNGNEGIGLDVVTETLVNNASYFVEVIDNKTVKLYDSAINAINKTNVVGLGISNTSGTHKFSTLPNQKSVIGIEVIDGGTLTNRKLHVKPTGISTQYNKVVYKDHGFGNGDIVEYTTAVGVGTTVPQAITGLTISTGITTTANYYQVLKVDNDSFRLTNAGLGGTDPTNFNRDNFVKFESEGKGFQVFKYPDISVSLKYSPVGFGTITQSVEEMILTPTVTGTIIDAYLYEPGTGYGSTIINFEKKPTITIQNGRNASLKANIIGGKLDSVDINYGGVEYYSVPDLEIVDSTGAGSGAKLRPIITNNKISSVQVVSTGIGYSAASTTVKITSAGKGGNIDCFVRPLTIDMVEKYGDSELFVESDDKLKYTVVGYGETYRTSFGEVGTGITIASKIIGWAYDGNPIYGPFAYSNPQDSNSTPKRLLSGYSLDASSVFDRPSTTVFPEGFFVDDNKFDDSGDLDANNGRFAKTPEFPDGIYAYYATIKDSGAQNKPQFPYFIGNSYRSIPQEQPLTQDYDYATNNLIRNTFPYRVAEKDIDNDFIIETNEISNQKAIIESVTSGTIDELNVVDAGDNYQINEGLIFNESGTNGEGLSSKVSSLVGRPIVDIQTAVTTFDNTILTWNPDNVQVNILPQHSLVNRDNVVISGLSTVLTELNGRYQIGIVTASTQVIAEVPTVGSLPNATEIYVSTIPESLGIGNSITIGAETMQVLEIYPNERIIRANRGSTGLVHGVGSTISIIPDSFTIPKTVPYFESAINNIAYFNPIKAVGFGVTPGVTHTSTFGFGSTTITRSIPTQTIYIPNHKFKNNESVTVSVPGGAAQISIANSSGTVSYNLPQEVYVTNRGKNYVGIKTGVGIGFSDVYFTGGGTNYNNYLITTKFEQVLAKTQKINSTVSISTSFTHGLVVGDQIDLNVKSNLSVGIGTSTGVRLKRNADTGNILVNPISFNNTGINSITNEITLSEHGLETGDRVFYEANDVASGLSTGGYFVFKVDDDVIKLTESSKDAYTNPPIVVGMADTGGSIQSLSLINPSLFTVGNSDLVFDIVDPSLEGYDLKFYYDNKFKNEFVSTGYTGAAAFTITGVGTAGIGTLATRTLNYDSMLPSELYYNLEKGGFISTADTQVEKYSLINFADSLYNDRYNVIATGSTTFDISLRQIPERLDYSNETSSLEYTTTSLTAFGGVDQADVNFSGFGYKRLPNFVGIGTTTTGSGAYIIPASKSIGNANQVRIINEGFEYSSDKTLKPNAFISPLIVVENSNTIGVVTVTDGGDGYLSAPNIAIVHPTTRKKIDSGLLKATLTGPAVGDVEVVVAPSGLPELPVELFTTNNTNGIGIKTVTSNNTGIFTCYITTPSTGYSPLPFTVGDEVFIENMVKVGTAGTGFNSVDLGYRFPKVIAYTPGTTDSVTLDATEFTTNCGVAVTDQGSLAVIINKNNYPTFTTYQYPSQFIVGEQIISNDVVRDLYITSTEDDARNPDFIKVFGTYQLSPDEVIVGKDSGTIAAIVSLTENLGRYSVSYAAKKDIGWTNDTGKLNLDNQVLPDNDYFQNLSYTVKSSQEYSTLRSPVNGLLHTAGLKNFADTGITSTTVVSGIGSTDQSLSIIDLTGDERVDTLYNWTTAYDLEYNSTVGNLALTGKASKFVEVENKRLSSYLLGRSNQVLIVDDINRQFSNLDGEPSEFLNLFEIEASQLNTFESLFVRVTNLDQTDIQTADLVLLNNFGTESVLLEKQKLNDETSIGTFDVQETSLGDSYLRFIPLPDAYNTDYDLKVIRTQFNELAGVGTYAVGFVNITGSVGIATTLSAGITTTRIVGLNSEKYSSLHLQNHLLNETTNEQNYLELYVTHDGENTYTSEYFVDTHSDLGMYSNTLMGEFEVGFSTDSGYGNELIVEYKNDSTDKIQLKSKIVGFGTTAVGVGTYRFLAPGQPQGSEQTALYQSDYATGTGTRNVFSVLNTDFNAVKSVIEVSAGSTKALHQVYLMHDTGDVYTQPSPFISVGSTSVSDSMSGIGSFNGKFNGNQLQLEFIPDSAYASTEIQVSSLNLCMYGPLDTLNEELTSDLEFGSGRENLKLFFYNAINGDRINRKNFTLTSGSTPIFAKTFNPAATNIVNLTSGTFSIDNHWFRTAEELIYKPNSTFVGVGSTPMQYVDSGGGINSLTSPVFAIRDGSDSFQIATTKTLALAGTGVTFVGVGTGNAHEFQMALANTKAVITIDNLIQSPLAYNPIAFSLQNNTEDIDGAGTLGIGTTATTFSLSGISSLGPDDIVRVGEEYMKILNLGIGTETDGPITGIGTTSLIEVERSFVGSAPSAHANNSTVQLYRGSYQIVGKEVYFTDSPRGNPQVEKDAGNLPFPTSSFTGRAFLRNDYNTNQIYDDITDEFTGLDTKFRLRVGGANTVGLGSTGGSGLVLISNIFQKPSAANNPDNNFEIQEDTSVGISSVVFTGIASATGDVYISDADVNQNQLPRGGVLISLGSTPGLGYAVPVPAKAYIETDAAGSITSIVGFPTVASTKNPITAADYDNVTGELELTTLNPTYFESGVIKQVKLVGLSFTCNDSYSVSNAVYQQTTGNLVLTIGANALGVGQSVGIATNSLTFTCSQDGYSSYHSYPRHGTDPIAGIATPIIERTAETITINVGTGTDSIHQFVGVGTDAVIINSGFSGITTTIYPKYPVGLTSTSEDYTILDVDERDYTHQFVGTATSALYSGGDFAHTFVSADTNAVNGSLTPNGGDYNANTGVLTLTFSGAHGVAGGGNVTIANASLIFKCSRDNFQTEHRYPRPSDPAYGQTLTATVPNLTTIEVPVGTSPASEKNVTAATYIPATGQVELTVGSGHGYSAASPITATNATYTQSTGRLVVTSNGHGLVTGDRVLLTDGCLTFTCAKDSNATEHSYPRVNDPAHAKWLAVHVYTINTFTVYVGAAADTADQYAHTFISGATNGILKKVGKTVGIKTESLGFKCSMDNYATIHDYPRYGDPAGDGSVIGITSVTTSTITLDVGKLPRYRFTTNVGVNSIPHRYLGRGYALPWYGDATYGSAYSGSVSIGITDSPYDHKFVSATSNAIEIGGDYGHSFVSGSSDLANAVYSGGNYKHTFVSGVTDSVTKVTGGGKLTPVGAAYTGSTGVLQITFASAHGISGGQSINIDNGALTFTCDRDNNATEHAYPRASDPIAGVSTVVTVPTTTTVQLNVGSSPNVTTTITSPYAEYSPGTGIVTFFVASHNFNSPTTHTIADAGYNPTTGYLDLTVTGHGWQTGEYVKIAENSLRFTCALDNHATDHYYPRFSSADKDETGSQWLPIQQVGVNTFAVYVGVAGDINAGIHTFVSASQPLTKSVDEIGIKTDSLAFTCGRDDNQSVHTYPRLGKDPLNISYSKVVGIATTGATSFSIFVGVTTNSTLDVLDSTYEGGSGVLKVVVGEEAMTAVAANNNRIGIVTESLTFTCDKDNHRTDHAYPRLSDPVVGICTDVISSDATSFDVFVGSSVGTNGVINASIVEYNKHNFITAGVGSITANAGGPFTATTGTEYDPSSGILTVTTTGSHGFTQSGINTAKSGTTYNPTTGILEIETVGGAHGWSNGDLIKIEENSLTFTCTLDGNATQHTYPRPGDPIHNKWIPISNASFATFQVNCLKRVPSTNTSTHTFVSAAASGIQKANNTVGFTTGGLTFTCAKNNHLDLHTYPRPKKDPVHNATIGVEQVFAANKFTVNVGKSPSGTGARLDLSVGAAGTNYINPSLIIPEPSYSNLEVTGISRLGEGPTTNTGSGLLVNVGMGQRPRGDEHRFVSAGINSVTRSIGGTLTVSDAGYIPSTGILELSFTGAHGLSGANTIQIANDSLTFTCGRDNFNSEHDYPRTSDPVSGQSIAITEIVDTDTIKVFVGITTFSDLPYGEMTEYGLTRSGYGFRRGDQFTPVGLVTDSNLREIVTPAIFTAVDIHNDSFAAWQFGQFDYIDSIKNQQDGSKTRFELKYDGSLLAFESEDTPAFPEMNLSNALLIIINGAIQEPGVAYDFDGGTSFVFREAPRATDDVSIFFYRGTDGEDTLLITDIKETLKPGDIIELLRMESDKVSQTDRTIEAIVDSDRIETSFYTGAGITSERKQFSWTKQKVDKIIGGQVVSKARSITEPLVFPTAKIIRDLSSTETGQIFVDNASIFNYEGDLPTKPIGGFIVDNAIAEPRAASLTATINASGQLSGLTIVDGGLGYVGASTNLSVGIPTSGIGVGIGTTATATATITNGVISGTSITNAGFGYTSTNVPKVIAPLPLYKSELVSNITAVQDITGSITGIGTTTKAGSSSGLALMFEVYSAGGLAVLADGRPISVFDTQIGTGVTSIYDSDSEIIGIGTEFLDNIYNISGNHGGYSGTTSILVCNIKSDTVHTGLSTTGAWTNNPAGHFSMGRLSGTITRNTGNPIAIGVSGLTVNSGLTTFPTIQRRIEGFRDTGAVDPTS